MPQQLACAPRIFRRRASYHLYCGQPAVSMEPGDAAYFPAGVKHWHGAKAGSWFSHLAFELPGENTSNEWLEPVTDAEYRALAE